MQFELDSVSVERSFKECLSREVANGLQDVKLFVTHTAGASQEAIENVMHDLHTMIMAKRNQEFAPYKSLQARMSEASSLNV